MLSSLLDIRADALRLHLTLQDDPHYAERRQAVLRKKVEQCADTFKTLLDRDPLTAFRDQMRRELGEVGRVESLPWGLTLNGRVKTGHLWAPQNRPFPARDWS